MHAKIGWVDAQGELRLVAESTRGLSVSRVASRQELASFITSSDFSEHASAHTPLETETFVGDVRCVIRLTVSGMIFVCGAPSLERSVSGSSGELARARAFLTTIQAQHDAAASVKMSDVSLGDLLSSVMDSEIDRRAVGDRERRVSPRGAERSAVSPRSRGGGGGGGGGGGRSSGARSAGVGGGARVPATSSDPLAALAQQYNRQQREAPSPSSLRALAPFASPSTPTSPSERAPLAGGGAHSGAAFDVERGGGGGGGGGGDVLHSFLAKASDAVDELRGGASRSATYGEIGGGGAARGGACSRRTQLIGLGVVIVAALLYGLFAALCGRMSLGTCRGSSSLSAAHARVSGSARGGGHSEGGGASAASWSASGNAAPLLAQPLLPGMTRRNATATVGEPQKKPGMQTKEMARGANSTASPFSLSSVVSTATKALAAAIPGTAHPGAGSAARDHSGAGGGATAASSHIVVALMLGALLCLGCGIVVAVVAMSWSRVRRAYEHWGGGRDETVGLAAAGAVEDRRRGRGRGRHTPRAAIRPLSSGGGGGGGGGGDGGAVSYTCDEDTDDDETLAL
jgi:hypothetical protein